MADQETEDLGIISSFIEDTTEDTNTGIFSAFVEDTSDEEEYTPGPLIKDTDYINDTPIRKPYTYEEAETIRNSYISAPDSEIREEPEVIRNPDTGKFEVNDRFAVDNPSMLPSLNYKALVYNEVDKLREEYFDKVASDPLNTNAYTEEYSKKIEDTLKLYSKEYLNSMNTSSNATKETSEGGFTNAVAQGANHALYNEHNQLSFAKTFTTSMWERGKDILPFAEPNAENVYITKPFEPTGITSDFEASVESISKSLVEMAIIMGTAGVGAVTGALVGSIVPGLGTASGAGGGGLAGTITGSATIANSMYGETLANSYYQYLNEGLDKNTAMMRAVTDATAEGVIEFGTDLIGAGVAKLSKMGIPLSKVVQSAGKLAKSGMIRKTEAGTEITKAGLKLMEHDIKSMLKSAGKVAGKGALTEGGEELLQGTWEAGRHRKKGQSWAEAVYENAGTIGKQALTGGVGGSLGIGGARGVTKAIEVGGGKLANYLENKAVEKETANAALEAAINEETEDIKNTEPKYSENYVPYKTKKQELSKEDQILNDYNENVNPEYYYPPNYEEDESVEPTKKGTYRQVKQIPEFNVWDDPQFEPLYTSKNGNTEVFVDIDDPNHRIKVTRGSSFGRNQVAPDRWYEIREQSPRFTKNSFNYFVPENISIEHNRDFMGNVDSLNFSDYEALVNEYERTGNVRNSFNLIQTTKDGKTTLLQDVSWNELETYLKNTYIKKTPSSNVTPIGTSYGTEIQGNQEVDAQGDTVLTDKETSTQPISQTTESVNEDLEVQNNENSSLYSDTEDSSELNTTRNEVAKANDINNTELENTIPGSVSDNGYSSSESYPVEGTGLARKDEVPTTPETAKNNIAVHHDETIKAMNVLGIKYADRKGESSKRGKLTIFDLLKDGYIQNDDGTISRYKYNVKNDIKRFPTKIKLINDEGTKVIKLEDVKDNETYTVNFIDPNTGELTTNDIPGRLLNKIFMFYRNEPSTSATSQASSGNQPPAAPPQTPAASQTPAAPQAPTSPQVSSGNKPPVAPPQAPTAPQTPVAPQAPASPQAPSGNQPPVAPPQTPATQQAPATPTVSNEEVSSIHKYYGVKNFVESVGSAVTDRLGKPYKLFVKGELSNKEKRLRHLGRTVRAYVRPMVDNVIRISNSRDYPALIHETVHHLVAKMQLLQNELANTNTRKLLRREHRRLENIDPTYRLNEAGYRQRGQDIYEEYFSNIVAAYGTGAFVPDTTIVDLINQGMEQVGVTDQFNTMRQQFLDYNSILDQPNGALKIAENNMRAIGLVQQGKFDTTNLTAKQLSTFKKLINYSASLPRRFIETWLNENYQIEKDAVRTDKFNEILKADQALQLNNRIANAFITGTGVYFNNGNLHKLERSKAIKSLAKIYAETKALGEGYDKTLESLLWAKQTIGESTGTQAKANALLTLTKDLGYSSWENARTDLKLLSLLAQASLYQGRGITSVDLNNIRREAQTIINRDGGVPLTSLPSERESVLTDLRRVNFNDPNLLTRLNAIINYVQARAITHAMNNPSPGSTQTSIKNDYIRDTYILDKQGEVNTGMSLSEALRIYTSLQSNPKIQQLESLETDVRTLFNSLENLMSASSTASRLRIALAKNSTGAWYIPLLRFIDPNEEKAIGIATLGNSFKSREGSSREVLGIFTSIENSIKAVANTVTKDQAIDYLLRLKDTPIFAQYMREVPADSVEVKVNLLDVVNNKIKEVEQQLYALQARGELPPNLNPALPMPNNIQNMNYYQYLRNIKENIERGINSGNLSTEEIMASIWIDTQPSNKNIIQRLEDDGRLHYYLINDTLKNFIYNQRKSIGNIQLSNQYIKDSLNLIAKVNNILQTIARTSYTVASIPFQLANIPRDTLDVAIKGDENNTFTSGYLGLIPRYITQLYNYFKVAGGLLSAKNREEFNTLTTLFGGAEQTQYREGEYTTTYLNYKLNKKGKIVRGGMVGWLETLIDMGGMSDLITRVAVLKNRCRQLGLDIHDINATYDDYLSLELPKNLLERYITDSDIETIFGRDKADAWRATKDTEYIPFVPEEFEKRQLNNILSAHQNEIDSRVNPDLRAELQELYNRSSIDFSKGTALTRSLGKVFMFFNTRTQGGYQYLRYANSHTRSFSGSISALLTLGILGTLLGWEDDDPEDKEKRVLKGLHIEDDSLGINVILPTQSFPLIPHRIGVSIGRLIKNIKEYNNINKSGASEEFKEKLYNERLDKTIGKDLITELTGIAWDNSVGSFDTPSGLAGALLGSLSFLPFGELPNYGDEKKYHEFSYYAKKKAGINVDTLTKKSDTWVSRKLSEWLVDNGIYKYSAHEINRYLKLYFGNAVSQVEGMLGLKTILDDKDNNINWFKYTSDQVDALLSSMTKPFTVPLFVQNYSSKEIDRLEFESLSKYDRLTGQTGTTARNRVKPEYLSDEDKLKFQKLYDIHYLARRAQSNLKGIYSIIDKIDRSASGGEKAYREAVQIYRDYADYAKDMLDSYDPFEEGAVPYQKIYPLLDEKKNVSIGKVNSVVKNSAKKAEEGGFRDSLIGKGIDAILKATTSEAKAEDTIDINTGIRNNLEADYKNFYEDRKNPDLKKLLSYANVREELNKKAHKEAFSENNKASDKAESEYNSVVQFDISNTDNGNPDIPYKSTAKIEVSDRRINDKDWVNIQRDGDVTVGPYQANSRNELKEFFNSGNLETFVEKKDVPQLIKYPEKDAHLFPAKPTIKLEPLTNKGKRVRNFKVTPYYKYMLDDNNKFINLESEEGIKRLKTLSKDKTFINELVKFHDNKFETAFTKSELPSGKNNIIKNLAHSVFTYTGNLTGIKPGKTAAETIKKSLIYLKKNNPTYGRDARRLAKEAFAFYRTALGKGTLEENLNLFDTYDETRHSSIKNKNNKFKSINEIFGYLDKENHK